MAKSQQQPESIVKVEKQGPGKALSVKSVEKPILSKKPSGKAILGEPPQPKNQQKEVKKNDPAYYHYQGSRHLEGNQRNQETRQSGSGS